jgi:hypothetical protein
MKIFPTFENALKRRKYRNGEEHSITVDDLQLLFFFPKRMHSMPAPVTLTSCSEK